MTELAASTGGLVQVLGAGGYDFDEPSGVSSDGTDVWVTNAGGNSVSELSASTGALVGVLSGPSYGFDQPSAISSDGVNAWVTNVDHGHGLPGLLTGRPARAGG